MLMMKNAPLPAISESIGDTLSAGGDLVHDLGTTAVARAGGLARRLGRRRVKVWWRQPKWMVAIAIAAVGGVVAAGIIRSRRARAGSDEWAVAGEPTEFTERAAAASGGG
jgi:hypothetical protein